MKNNTEFKIEKGIKMPNVNEGRGRRCIYPWSSMKMGDSFYADKGPVTLLGAARRWTSRRKLKYRWVTKKEGTGNRIWRVK